MSVKFDYCILGAGLAGLSLADSLQDRGLSVCVIEKNHIGSGASGTPGGLVNPATGRRATKSWKAEGCYKAISENLDKVSPYSEESFYNKNGVLRPALTEKMARKMQERFLETTWEEGWCLWQSEKEIKERHPGINCLEGGLWLPVGISVDSGQYLQALAAYLEDNKVKIFTEFVPTVSHEGTNWKIKLPERKLEVNQLVYATGYATLSLDYWKDLPFNPIKGQVALFKTDSDKLNFDHSISSLGYIANLNNGNTFVQGSTYEHDFNDIKPDAFGEEYLRKRLRRTLPGLEERSEVIDQWAGVRVSTPDRKPVLGRHKDIKNLHLFTGLGSKGLLYGKYLADHYADHLIDGAKLYKEISIDRLYNS